MVLIVQLISPVISVKPDAKLWTGSAQEPSADFL